MPTAESREALVSALVTAIKAFQDSVDRFDAAAAARLCVNETDLRCLTHLADAGPRRPSDLAETLGLTRGAMTTVLSRLRAAGHLDRSSNEADGRSHFIRLSATAKQLLEVIWAPILREGAQHLSAYSDAQLRDFTVFMERSIDVQARCRADLIERSSRDPALS